LDHLVSYYIKDSSQLKLGMLQVHPPLHQYHHHPARLYNDDTSINTTNTNDNIYMNRVEASM
jgi:hypothetical protein